MENKNGKKQNYLTGAAILSLSTIIVKVIGMFYKIPLQHHRAVNDAEATAKVMYAMLAEIRQKGYSRLSELNYLSDTEALVKSAPKPNHFIILCKK